MREDIGTPALAGAAPAIAQARTSQPTRLTRSQIAVLATALAGSLLIALSGQLVGSGLADIQGGIGATADEGSWLTTSYTMALLVGIIISSPIIGAFGAGRYMAASGLVFAATAAACAMVPSLPWMIVLRSLQGLAAGGFGPIAFVATFGAARGGHLRLGLAILALVLLLPGSLAPVVAGYAESRFAWHGLFLIQAAIGSGIALAAILLVPRAKVAWPALRRDWGGLLLLAIALAASLLVLSQGTRRDWLDSALIIWSLAIAAGGWAGFLVTLRHSPLPVLSLELLAKRTFIVPIILNLLFRAGFAGSAFLVPQFLTIVQGHRPFELAQLTLWSAVPQLLALPLTWWLLRWVEGRLVAAGGLLLFGIGLLLAANGTSLDAAGELRASLAMAGAGQVMFLVPNLIAGGMALTPPDAPTATLAFNGTSIGGTSLGIALATELLTRRQAFHASTLTEAAAANGAKLERVEALAGLFAARVSDDVLAAARATSALAAAIAREAAVASFNDAFLLLAGLILTSCGGLLLMQRQPPLKALRSEV